MGAINSGHDLTWKSRELCITIPKFFNTFHGHQPSLSIPKRSCSFKLATLLGLLPLA